MEGKKIGLALAGGGARGLCHIGVLKALESENIKIGAISGTSMGALIGAIYSSGTTIEELEDYVSSFDWKSYLLFSDITFSGKGLINGKKIETILERFLKDKTFDQCNIEFNCVAVDILERKKIVITSGTLKEAIMASISIPGLFNPVVLDGRVLVDGGVMEPLPTKSLSMLGPDLMIASLVGFKKTGTLR
jgi:NTE family protein